MKKLFISLALILAIGGNAYAHSGRTDKKGGHNCSAKSKKKGLCTGYHYHKNGTKVHVQKSKKKITPSKSKN